jgi:putative spermidine/putrescine transport system permease protein
MTIAKNSASPTSIRGGRGWSFSFSKVKFDKNLIGVLPLLAFLSFFLLYPIASIISSSLHDNSHHVTLSLYKNLFSGNYRDAFIGSFKLAFYSMLVSGVLGALISWAVVKTTGVVRTITTSAAGVLANTGGVPLAFMFIAAFGQEGLITKLLLKVFHWDLYGGSFDLYNFWGILLVYCFFQIPLMVIIFSPALENLKPEWMETNESLGGSKFQYFRHVLIPILLPSFISASLLLFASAFSAFATAAAMSNGSIPLAPLFIGNLVNGNVIAGQENQGDAMAMGMVLVSLLVIAAYLLLLRVTRKR